MVPWPAKGQFQISSHHHEGHVGITVSHPNVTIAHLRALAEGLVEVDKGEAVLDVVLLKALKSSLATLLADVDGLDPRLDVLL